MIAETRTTVERQLLKLIDEDDLDADCIGLLAGDRTATDEERIWIEKLRSRRGARLYSDALFFLTQERFPEDRAESLWAGILGHKLQLSKILGRNVGVIVASLDYLTNLHGLIAKPLLIRAQKMNRVAEIALQDGLTGLFDHSTFVRKVEHEVTRAKRYEDSLCVALADVDDFKQVNDQHGHLRGDEVLSQIGGIVAEVVRETDVAGRYGGEEFGMLMPRTSGSEGQQVAERLRGQIERSFGSSFGVTVSVGVATMPHHGITASTLIQAADDALYSAKRAGKNRVLTAP